jgi:type I restriction enzyme S subunit
MKITKHKLGKLCDIRIGRTPARANASYWGEGNPWLSIADMKEKYVTRTKEEITDRAVNECNCTIVPKGTLLMSFKLSIGKMAIAGRDIYTNEAIAAFVPKQKDLDVEYLYYALKHYSFGSLNVAAKGATLNKSSLALLSVPVPESIDDQRRIAALLSRAEGLITQRKESIRLLDELVRSVFLEMFGDPVRNEKGWKTEPFANVVQILGGGTPSKSVAGYFSGSIPWATSKDVKDEILYDTIDHVSPAGLDSSASQLVPEDTVLVVVKSKILLHRLPVALTGVPMCFNQDLKALVPNERMHPYVLFQLVRLFEPVLLRQARGVNTEGLTNAHWRRLRLPLLPEVQQLKFVDLWRRMQVQKKNLFKSLQHLEQLYGSLSQRAFRGELTLKQGPTHEFSAGGITDSTDRNVAMPVGEETANTKAPSIGIRAFVGNVSGQRFKRDFTREVIMWARLKDFVFAEFEEAVRRRNYEYTYDDLVQGIMDGLSAEPPFLTQEYSGVKGADGAPRMMLRYIG